MASKLRLSPLSELPQPGVRQRARALLAGLASLKLTLVILVLLGAGILVSYRGWVPPTWALAGPLLGFALNLGAAVATNAAFRRQPWLLAFHFALIAIVLLVAAGRMSYLRGNVELSAGEAFTGKLTTHEAGPLHWWRLDRVRFINDGFSITYHPGPMRDKTTNRVRWLDDSGAVHSDVIGDQKPLVLHGYRFYTTFNKGFAPFFLWTPKDGGAPQAGGVHLPGWPAHEHKQAQEWVIPGTQLTAWTMLQFDEVILDPERPSEFRPPKQHKLVVRVGSERRELVPGDRFELPEGTLAYQGLHAWMGYTVFSDWTIPWLLGACVAAVLSIGMHFWQKFRSTPWSAGEAM